jgi:hypothetical protein
MPQAILHRQQLADVFVVQNDHGLPLSFPFDFIAEGKPAVKTFSAASGPQEGLMFVFPCAGFSNV